MSSHPLSSSSRRRRMIMYLSRQQTNRDLSTAVEARRTAVVQRAGTPLSSDDAPTVLVTATASETAKVRKGTRPTERQRPTCHQHQLRVRSLLSQETPANWVFCGDSLLTMSDKTRDWPSYVGHFSHFVRWQIRRFPDTVIDACLPTDSIATVCSQIEQRVLRFQPQAAFIMCGIHEATAGIAGLPRFETALRRMLKALIERGITPIVQTPPCPTEVPQPEQLVYVEAIRAITAEEDVPLVDHWEVWESATAAGRSSAWYETKSSLPGKTGHEQLAELTLRTLGLSVHADAKTEPGP